MLKVCIKHGAYTLNSCHYCLRDNNNSDSDKYNPFIKKVGENEYRCLFGVSADEANRIFSGRNSSMNELDEAQIQINRILSDLEKKTGRVVTSISVYEDRGRGIPSQRFVEVEMSSKPGEDYLM